MTEAIWFVAGFAAGFSLLAFSKPRYITELERRVKITEKSRTFWFDQAAAMAGIQEDINTIERELRPDGDCA